MRNEVSVVLATYNGIEFIERQLDTILNQTIVPKEIVIVDDCSTDGTCEFISSYRDKHPNLDFKLVFREENIGYVMNYIDGINRTTFDTVFLCDQDDLWEFDKVEVYLSLFESNQKAIAIHGEIDIIDVKDQQIRGPQYRYKEDCGYLDIKKFVKRVNYAGMSLAFKKNKILPLLNQMIDDKVCLATHDWIICYIASLQDGLFKTNNILTHRRYTGTNVALRLNQKRLSGIESRIDGINTYLLNYQMALACQNLKYIDNSFDIIPYIDTFEERKTILKNKNRIRSFLMIRKIKYFPSLKSYIGDIILQFRN